jgi:ubiquinone/menaquinone biosynthesis C-methylase UbiE
MSVLDVGCGPGHYLRSLLNRVRVPFTYTGVDATEAYIRLARKAWRDEPRASFEVGEAAALPFKSASFDIVMSCNVFQHLPAVQSPFAEAIRVMRRRGIVRMFVGERSFRIQEVYSAETHPASFAGALGEEEFGPDGEPMSFHYYNIYSKTYIHKLIARIGGADAEVVEDRHYDPAAITASTRENTCPDTTTMLDGWQVNGYILQPWAFVKLRKRAAGD